MSKLKLQGEMFFSLRTRNRCEKMSKGDPNSIIHRESRVEDDLSKG